MITVALSFAPQTVTTAAGVREARRLRGRPHKGIRGMRGLAVPVLEGALERLIDMAASMDSRGYGRRGTAPASRRRAGQAMTLVGAGAIIIGVFGVLNGSGPFFLGLPMLAMGALLLAASLQVARASAARSRYRPDVWRLPEWLRAERGMLHAAAAARRGLYVTF